MFNHSDYNVTCEFIMVHETFLLSVRDCVNYSIYREESKQKHNILYFYPQHEGGADVKRKQTYTVKVECTPDAVPIEKALTSLAQVIAREMFRADKQRKEGKI